MKTVFYCDFQGVLHRKSTENFEQLLQELLKNSDKHLYGYEDFLQCDLLFIVKKRCTLHVVPVR